MFSIIVELMWHVVLLYCTVLSRVPPECRPLCAVVCCPLFRPRFYILCFVIPIGLKAAGGDGDSDGGETFL